jgi:Fe-S cluster assembly iron-binding protein IscA
MIRVTDRARDSLKDLLFSKHVHGRALRLEASGSGALGIVPGTRRHGDYTIEHDGLTVLLIAPALAARLDGTCLDCEETAFGRHLVLTAPRWTTAHPMGA